MRCPGCRASWTSTASAWRLAAADLETPGARYRKGKRPEKDPLVPAHDRAPHLDRPSRTALRRVGHAARVSGGHLSDAAIRLRPSGLPKTFGANQTRGAGPYGYSGYLGGPIDRMTWNEYDARMNRRLLSLGLVTLIGTPLAALGQHSQSDDRLNPMIKLHEQGLPVFGLQAPGGRDGASPAQRAAETLGFIWTDYVYDGSMEAAVEELLPSFLEYVEAMGAAGASARTHPLVVKTPKIALRGAAAINNISRQLNAGASGIVFVGVESAEEVRRGLAAMRFRSKGGTRPDDVGDAPAYWGLTEMEYRTRADPWPLNPDGELINWAIVESLEGLQNVREIAAVEGLGVLFAGANTLREVFSTTGAGGEWILDDVRWEGAIQKVLAACHEFHLPCGYPPNENDVEERLRQGFSVFLGAGERGFTTIDIGRRAAGR